MTDFVTTKSLLALRRKQLAARILMWTCLAAAVLPISAAVGFLWYRYAHPKPLAGLGFLMTVHLWLPIPLFGFLGFVSALEWKQGLDERIKKLQTEGTKDVTNAGRFGMRP